jgi:hypothetical protein
MPRSVLGRFAGLPKEFVVGLLAVALVATVVVDLSSPPARFGASGPWMIGYDHAPGPVRNTRTTLATTTTGPPATTTTGAPRGAPAAVHAPAPPPPAPAGHIGHGFALGVYAGAANPSGVAAFAAATGTRPGYASDFLPGNSGWAGMTDPGSLAWLLGPWRGTGYTLVLGVPMVPTDGAGNPQASLAGGAAGQYGGEFVTLADTLVSYGQANAVLRLGWEFNGTWFPWSAANAADAANYAAYFRNIVNAMRSVPGQAFRFVWNPNGGDSHWPYSPDQAYPGSAYVDYIGTDVYDNCWCSPPSPQAAWNGQLSSTWGLDWLAGFAAAQGRPIVFPEWGASIRSDGRGLGDNPYFISSFAAWVAQHDVAWASYFNYDAPDGVHNLLNGRFPADLATFRATFG